MRSHLDLGGHRRTFTVIGSAAADPGRALLLVFHGSKQTGDAHRAFTGGQFDALPGTVVAYLDGYRGNWNDARRESAFPARTAQIDDVAFARAVVAELAASHGIDPQRVYGVGYSNGGQMVMRLLHEPESPLAGGAIVAATLPAPESFLLDGAAAAARPGPVVLVHGTRDPISPIGGGAFSWWAKRLFKVGGRMLSLGDTAAHFARRNGITTPPEQQTAVEGGNGTRWMRADYRGAGRPPVVAVTVERGGHTVPGPTAAPRVLGRTATAFTTAELVAEAFGLAARSAG
jgi:polyhydroxybutyrate depolymerase